MSGVELVMAVLVGASLLALVPALYVLGLCAYDVWAMRDDPWLADNPRPHRTARLHYGVSACTVTSVSHRSQAPGAAAIG